MAELVGAVAVAGGGIAGIQSALDLADSGLKVYLIESTPSIGGVMAQLDKTFPTLDCSMCTLSPKLAEASRHPNIKLLTYSEIKEISGDAGNFEVTVTRKATYVDPDKCTACELCLAKCPAKVLDEYNAGMSKRKAIYLPFPQAVPRVMTIDAEHCIYLTKGKCGNCKKVCENDAIDYEMKDKDEMINVGSVILSTGFAPFDPTELEQFHYEHLDVVTSLEFERLLSSSGPYVGHVKMANGETPKKIAWLQCIGSRNPEIGRPNCSAVCCMYATKEAMVAMEHDSELETTIFNIDLRAFGKGFEQFYQRAKNETGIRFIRSRPSGVDIDPITNRLSVRYEVEGSTETAAEEFDMVILSIGLTPSESSKKLAEIAGVEMDEYGNIATTIDAPMTTSVPGIFACGTIVAPKDIPDTVADASGAASKAHSILASARGTLVTERMYPPEKDITEEEPRIGVVVCDCGINIASVVDVPAVVEYVNTLPHVVHAYEQTYACSTDSLDNIKDVIKEHNLNRVVVASCTPRTHEPLFQDTCRDAGLNPYLFELANIREHCSWVHQQEPELATEKAKDIVRMSVARVALLDPLYTQKLDFNHGGVVIGGGVAGMTAALDIAEKGFTTYLIEKEPELGGLLRTFTRLQDGRTTGEILDPMIAAVTSNPNLTVYTGTTLDEVEGAMGRFKGKLSNGTEIEFGSAIIATGANEFVPEGYFGYGADNVITQSVLEVKLDEGTVDATNVVMIQCAGGRNDERPYCSRVCCTTAMKNAIRLKEEDPERNIYVLYRDIRTYGVWEELYTRARETGVLFMRYNEDDEPVVSDGTVTITDKLLNDTLFEIATDLVVLSAPLVAPDGVEDTAMLFKVPVDSNRFFLEAHIKLRPVDFATDGVFLAGSAQAPKLVDESISQASAAASRACSILAKEQLETSGVISVVDEEVCIGCGRCVEVCPYGAPELKEVEIVTEEITYMTRKSEIDPAICKGCGSCAAECPTSAITSRHFTTKQISAVIDAFAFTDGSIEEVA
uniref:CoB--CoM heterodisulfide reductase iron-sulfur subunit A n=1 Tax=Candidatus Methanogaster sp. ANME-2c ERB4 TaxID=2759911 RepID=A0A7G9Y6Y9_9EURY|nr:NAD(P)H-quinone oxidoreductase subunit I, chloroplastic [Methanosarcinales archaeon ANME-2c ERB4]QNO43872.1 NAD(P)H-quinone oxidoreductase subunit I, chloroplastic [Methanosarcinales archaeon ANME-2c ERB4]